MRHTKTRRRAAVGALLMAGALAVGGVAGASGVRFSDYTPLASSAGVTATEATPITFGNPTFEQTSIADRDTQLANGQPNSGNWDMIAVNETGPQKGKYLFTPFETNQAGIQRQDLDTGVTETVWIADPGDAERFDPSFWTPWGTYITGEESWCTDAAGCTEPYGRLFELTNPLTAAAVTDVAGEPANVVHRNVIPRVAHEGIQFDQDWNMYFVDELSGGSVYKYVSAASSGEIMSGQQGYFDAGQTFVLRVGDGNTPNATGAYTWVPLTDEVGDALPGAIVITDTNGVTSVDGRNTVDLAAFKGTDYQRPEDVQTQTVHGVERLYVNMTGTHETYVLDLGAQTINVFASQATIDLATSTPVGSAFSSPDNLAVDADGNIYIVEDRPGGADDDIWFANDLNGDGDLTDPGEGIGRWASNGTTGSEFTGLYFDPTNKRRAWVNIQHPDSENDRTIEITIP